jgi:hypothetical protein
MLEHPHSWPLAYLSLAIPIGLAADAVLGSWWARGAHSPSPSRNLDVATRSLREFAGKPIRETI